MPKPPKKPNPSAFTAFSRLHSAEDPDLRTALQLDEARPCGILGWEVGSNVRAYGLKDLQGL